MKKTLIILLFALLISCKPTYDFKVNGLCYDINSDGKSVTVTREYFFSNSPSYPNLEGELAIPASVKYKGTNYSVTEIGEEAFSFCTGLTSVAIPNSVTEIGEGAFNGCISLTSVTIPNSVTSIGEHAFSGCTGLTSVTIPDSVTTIGEGAFNGCTGLTSIVVKNGNPKYDSRNNCNAIIETETNTLIAGCKNTTIPDSVTTIGEGAFNGCTGLTSVAIPNSVTEIGEWAFSGCTGLTSIVVKNGNPKYDSRNNCNAIIETETNTLIAGCKNTTIPNSVTTIGQRAFYGCTGLTSVNIPNSVTSIGYGAFNGCTGLTSIVVKNGNPKYDSRNNCNAITETETNTLIAGCKNTTIPNSVTTIGQGAFYGCTGLTSVNIPNSVTEIGEWAFNGCTGLTSIVVKNGNPKYDSRNNCNAIIETETNTLIAGCKNTTIPNSVTTIGQWAFSGCTGLTSVNIPNSVTEIGRSAFEDCIGLTSVTIPNSVTVIDGLAFFGCSGLTSITSRIQNPKEVGLGANNFDVVDKENCVLYVPAASVKLYKEAPQWNEFSNIKGF